MFSLEKPGRYYATLAGAWFSMFFGLLLFSVVADKLGYGSIGDVLTLLFGFALIALVIWAMVAHINDQSRAWDAKIKRQVEEDFDRFQRGAAEREREVEERELRRQAKRDDWREEHAVDSVYFIVDRHRQAVKIGVSRFPEKRLKDLQVSNAHKLELVAVMRGSYDLEQRLHIHYAQWRMTGEWFELVPELLEAIEYARASEGPGHRNDAIPTA